MNTASATISTQAFGAALAVDFPAFFSTNTSGATQLAGSNLDGPDGLDGPQAGLLSSNQSTGGTGVIVNGIRIVASFSSAITQAVLDAKLAVKGIIFEFGSDYAFVPVPAALPLLLTGLGLLAWVRRRHARGVSGQEALTA